MLICSSVCLLEDNTDKAFSSNSENAGKGVLVRWCLCSICITLVVKHNKWLCNRENVYSSSFVPHWELPVPAGTAGSVDCYLLYLIICFCECQELENRNNNMFRDLILSHDPQGLFPPLIPKGQLQVVEVEKVMRKDSCEGLIWTCWSVLKTMIISTSHPPCPTVIVPTSADSPVAACEDTLLTYFSAMCIRQVMWEGKIWDSYLFSTPAFFSGLSPLLCTSKKLFTKQWVIL